MNLDSSSFDAFVKILQEGTDIKEDLRSCINNAVKKFLKDNEEMILQSAFYDFYYRLSMYSLHLEQAIADLNYKCEIIAEEARESIAKHNEQNPDDKYDTYDETSGLYHSMLGDIESAQTHPECEAYSCENFDEEIEKLDFRPNAELMDCLQRSISIISDETRIIAW